MQSTSQQYSHQPIQTGMDSNINQNYIMNQPPRIGYVNGSNQIIYVTPAPVVYTQYKAGQSKFLGVIQIIIGILCIAFNSTGIGIMTYYDAYSSQAQFIGYGIWGGIFFILTGSFGIGAAARKSRCLIITFMVHCIISAAIAMVILGLSAADISYMENECITTDRYYDNSGRSWDYWLGKSHKICVRGHYVRLAMSSLLIILSVFEGFFSVWGTIICGKVACCGAKTQNQYIIQPQPVMVGSMNGNQQVLILNTSNLSSHPAANLVYPVTTPPVHQTPLQSAEPSYPGYPGYPPATFDSYSSFPPYQPGPQPVNYVSDVVNPDFSKFEEKMNRTHE